MNDIRRAAFTASIFDCILFCGFLYGVFCLLTLHAGMSQDTASVLCIIAFVIVGVIYSWMTAITIRRVEYTMYMINREIEKQKQSNTTTKRD